jgi:simple sugar transport system permease protein
MSSQARLEVPQAPPRVPPAPPTGGALGGRSAWRTLIERREAAIFLVAVLLFAFFAIDSVNFISYDNFVNLTQFLAPIAVIGAGEVLLLTCGEVDLSLGTVFIFFPFMTYFLWHNFGFPLGIAIALSVVGAALFGLVNGLVTTLFNVPSFVTTLGTLFALWGVTLLSSGGVQETMTLNGLGGDILGNYSWSEIFWALGMILLVYAVLHRTRFGMHIVATGGNLLGAAESGIPVKRVKIYCFMFASAMAAIIGVIDSVRITTLDPGNDGTQEMFYAISAAVIGGTALTGGRGTAIGVAFGAIVLAVLYDGFNIVGLSAYTFQLILGIAIVGSMIINSQFQRAATSRLGRRRLNL